MKWELEEGGTLGQGGEYTPVQYPRSNDERALSNNNKGGASVDGGLGAVDYKVGPYPVVEDMVDGVDEGGSNR